ncbi:MAG: glycosyltransferase family 2 protein [Deltaproteobacteria bacterium]|nr:glycosyltransferase family 2 protein [Deltaproteobacteria bacterium]
MSNTTLDWSRAPKGLSVIIPVYNERDTIREILARVEGTRLVTQIVVVDDGSADGTRDILKQIEAEGRAHLTIVLHERNRGKGAAVRTGIERATGDLVLVQDADLEYDPRDYPTLLEPILDGRADVVFGSRFLGGPHRVLFFWHYVVNRMLTFLSNICTNLNLTDMEVGYKLFRREVLNKITIRSDRFNFEPEITAKVAKQRVRVYEVPISYAGRTYEEGKKIGAWDGIEALWTIFKYRFVD